MLASASATGGGPSVGEPDELLRVIGHRYEALAERQLDVLEALTERVLHAGSDPTEDVDALAQSVRLARRMRRLAKTLEVLADDPDRDGPGESTEIAQIIEDAIADNDESARVDRSSVDDGTVSGPATADLVHLLAELIDNALTASRQRGTQVVVLGRCSGEGYLLSVVDEGLGMTPEQRADANERLVAQPSSRELSPYAFGLATVARLTARHGIGVSLLESPTDGMIAKLRLPEALMVGTPQAAMHRSGEATPARGGWARDHAPSAVGSVSPGDRTGEAPISEASEPAVGSAVDPSDLPRAEVAERAEAGQIDSSAAQGRALGSRLRRSLSGLEPSQSGNDTSVDVDRDDG